MYKSESKVLAEFETKVQQAKEINAAEAITIAQRSGHEKAAAVSAGMLVGRIQMASSMSKIVDVVSLVTLKQIKESKEYKGLKGIALNEIAPVGNNSTILTGTWAEFCELCGMSRSKVDEDLKNLESFGEAAMESMQSLGMTTKDLRRLRQLPQEELTAIVEGEHIKISDRDEALEIIEELSSKHRQEKQALKKEVDELSLEKQSSERLLADKDKKINELSKQLDTPLTAASRLQKEEERNEALLNELNHAALSVDSGTARLFDAIQTVTDNKCPTDMNRACEDALFRCLDRFLNLSADMGISAHVIQHLEQWHSENALLFGLED